MRLTGLRTHEWNTCDISAVTNFKIREGLRFQVRADAVNAFNHPIFAGPNVAPANTLFGTVNNTNGAYQRMVEIIGRLTWQVGLRLNVLVRTVHCKLPVLLRL